MVNIALVVARGPKLTVMPRFKRGIQYAAASRLTY